MSALFSDEKAHAAACAFFVSPARKVRKNMTRSLSANALETEPIPRLMRRYALPCVISLLVGALYNLVDQLFIAVAVLICLSRRIVPKR